MNTSEKLRSLLDDNGIEWRETMSGNTSWFDADGNDVVVLRRAAGLVQVRIWLTPEQAVSLSAIEKG